MWETLGNFPTNNTQPIRSVVSYYRFLIGWQQICISLAESSQKVIGQFSNASKSIGLWWGHVTLKMAASSKRKNSVAKMMNWVLFLWYYNCDYNNSHVMLAHGPGSALQWCLNRANRGYLDIFLFNRCLIHTSSNVASPTTTGQLKSKNKSKSNVSKKYSDTLNLPQMPYELSVYKSDGRCNKREQYVKEVWICVRPHNIT